jgi:hypothetical protein
MYALISLPNHAMYISFISSIKRRINPNRLNVVQATPLRCKVEAATNINLKHTNMKYTVVIVETLSRKIEVDASDAQQAKQIIAEQYNNEQIVLSADDFYGYEIETL